MYPNAAVMAPFSNLPPPAMEARPPAVAETMVSPIRSPKSPCAFGNACMVSGDSAEPTAPESAPEPHDPPEAEAWAQPTSAWPATLNA